MKSRYKILVLVGLPLYGIFISSFNTALLFLLNPVAMTIHAMLNMPFFYNESMFQYEWFIHPVLNIISNLVFWIPVGMSLIKYLEKRENRRRVRK